MQLINCDHIHITYTGFAISGGPALYQRQESRTTFIYWQSEYQYNTVETDYVYLPNISCMSTTQVISGYLLYKSEPSIIHWKSLVNARTHPIPK